MENNFEQYAALLDSAAEAAEACLGMKKNWAGYPWRLRHSLGETPSSFLNTREKWAVSA